MFYYDYIKIDLQTMIRWAEMSTRSVVLLSKLELMERSHEAHHKSWKYIFLYSLLGHENFSAWLKARLELDTILFERMSMILYYAPPPFVIKYWAFHTRKSI